MLCVHRIDIYWELTKQMITYKYKMIIDLAVYDDLLSSNRVAAIFPGLKLEAQLWKAFYATKMHWIKKKMGEKM